MPTRLSSLLYACVAALASTPLPAQDKAPDVRWAGTWAFKERIQGNTAVVLEGIFTVEADSVTPEVIGVPCHWVPQSTSRKILWDCGRARLTFERFDPVRKAEYSMPVAVTERVRTCEEWQAVGNQRTCARWRDEIVERDVTRTGRLNARKPN